MHVPVRTRALLAYVLVPDTVHKINRFTLDSTSEGVLASDTCSTTVANLI